MSNNKVEYRRFIEDRKDIPVFFQDWWLDVVFENSWDVILHKNKSGEIDAFWPYKNNQLISNHPVLTPFLGIYLLHKEQFIGRKAISKYRRIIMEMVQSMNFIYFNQFFHPFITDWLPFYREGFNQQTFYKYFLPDITDLKVIFKKIAKRKQRYIRNFPKIGKIVSSNEPEDLYQLIKFSYKRNNGKIPFNNELYQNLVTSTLQKLEGRIYYAYDQEGYLLSGVFMIIDFDRAYLLNCSVNYERAHNGALSALIWQCIREASEYVKVFDFTGSMIEPFYHYLGEYGGETEPYFRIYKYRSQVVKTAFKLLNK